MSSFVISSITVVSTFITQNTAGVKHPPGKSFTAWQLPGSTYLDGTGSTEPVTFGLPSKPPLPAFPITVTGILTVPVELAKQPFVIKGSIILDGKETVVFETKDVVSETGVTPFATTGLTIDKALLDLPSYQVPFRITGDIMWTATVGAAAVTVPCPTPTRLEMAFMRTAAPSGPTDISNLATTTTQIDLKGTWPVALLREYLPLAWELKDAAFAANPIAWYLSRTAKTVWNRGNAAQASVPKYDAKQGASSFGAAWMGGTVNFDKWIAGAEPSCNCYDLAAMVQLGCTILTDQSITGIYEVADSRWVFQYPTGFVKNCLLYGWGQVGTAPPDYPSGINNPFFQLQNPPTYIGVADLSDLKKGTRLPFRNHAWIEAYAEPRSPIVARKVLDCTTAIWEAGQQPSPDSGTRTRDEYVAAHIDKAADTTPTKKFTGNTDNFLQSSPNSTGNCLMNNFAWFGNSPAQLRIGVWAISSIPLPPMLRLLLSSTGMPQTLREEIDAVLQKTANPEPPAEELYSNSRLSAQVLAENLAALETPMTVVSSSLDATGESSALHLVLADTARQPRSTPGDVSLSIHTFNDKTLAFGSLIHALAGYSTNNIASFFERPDPYIGTLSMIDVVSHKCYSVRGNHFVSVRHLTDHTATNSPEIESADTSDPRPSPSERVAAIAQMVDGHLAANEVQAGHHRMPSLHIPAPRDSNNSHDTSNEDTSTLLVSETESRTVRVGDVFELAVSSGSSSPSSVDSQQQHSFALLRGETGNGAIVVCMSPVHYYPSSSSSPSSSSANVTSADNPPPIQFYAAAEGETDVFVYAAHHATLAPGSVRCRVRVLPAASAEA